MVQRKYSALIIGCGKIGALNDVPGSGNENKIISYAHALKENGNFDVYYFDNDTYKAQNAIDIWGGRHSDNRIADITIIATPDKTHYDILKWEWITKTKLVICEKPLCSTVAEAKEIIELYEKAGIPILVDYTRRFIPELQDLKRRYYSGEFGQIAYASFQYNRGILHTGTHMFDFINWFFDKDYIVFPKTNEMKHCDYRVWNINLYFEKFHWQEQRIGDMPVPNYYDYHTKYVIDNAYNFLEGQEDLRCTMYDGLKALEIMERLCK